MVLLSLFHVGIMGLMLVMLLVVMASWVIIHHSIVMYLCSLHVSAEYSVFNTSAILLGGMAGMMATTQLLHQQ